MTPLSFWKIFTATLIISACCIFQISAYAAEAGNNDDSSKVHPVAEIKKVAKEVGHGVKKSTKVIGHGFRDGAHAVGHGARKVTRKVGHAFRDGEHKLVGKKD